jgi:predicted ABC-type ATPase
VFGSVAFDDICVNFRNKMIILVTGLSGSGKTNTGYSLMFSHFFKSIVFIESEWFSAKFPFDWNNKEDIESLYQTMERLIDFNVNRGESNFVITLGLPQIKYYNEYIRYFQKGIPILLVCLTCEKDEIIRRVNERGRHEKQRQLELDAVDGDYEYLRKFISANRAAIEINTTKITEDQIAARIVQIIKDREKQQRQPISK